MMLLLALFAVAGFASAMGPAAGYGKHTADLRHGFVTVSDPSLDFNTGGFSVEAWIRSDNPANGRYNSFVSHQLNGGDVEDQGNQYTQLNFQLQRNGELNAFVGCGGPVERTRNLGYLLPFPQGEQSPLSSNTGWTHVAVVIPDPALGEQARLFRNGAVVASVNWAEYAVRCEGRDMIRPEAGAAWNFGFYDNHDNGVQTWNGEVDEIRIWSGVRTADEIRQNRYRSTLTNSDGLRAWFRFNEMEGDQTPDEVQGLQATMVANDDTLQGLSVMWGYSTVGIWHPEIEVPNGDGDFGSAVLPFTAIDPATGEEWPPAGCPAFVCQWVVLSLPAPGQQAPDQPNWRVVVDFYGGLDENDVADDGFATGASELIMFSNSAPAESNFIRYYARDERGNGLTRPSPGTSGGYAQPHTRLTFFTAPVSGSDVNTCSGEWDECLICNGEGQFVDDCGQCFRNNVDEDDCGVCGGNGGDCSCPPPGYDGMWHADRMSYVLMKYAVGVTLSKVDETLMVLEDIIDKFNDGYEAVNQRTFIDYVELSIAFCESCLQQYLQELAEFEQELMAYCAANICEPGTRSVSGDDEPMMATGDFGAEDLGMGAAAFKTGSTESATR